MLARFILPPKRDWPWEPPFDPRIVAEEDMGQRLQVVELLGTGEGRCSGGRSR